ncbi:MAG: hypothetical protein GW949_01480 [Spirochaetales bacterium]|nr:hypothetical protein [Spirochaetales bacterium]
MSSSVIFLHLWNLNLKVLLAQASKDFSSVYGVLFPLPYAHSVGILGLRRASKRRIAFRSYQERQLAQAYTHHKIPLFPFPSPNIQDLDKLLVWSPSKVVYQPTGGWEERQFDRLIDRWGQTHGIEIVRVSPNTLIDKDELPFDGEHIPRTFTPFRQGIETKPWSSYRFSSFSSPDRVDPAVAKELPEELQGLEALGAPARMAHWFSTTAPSTYKETRNGMGPGEYSSKLSFWLSDGSLQAKVVGRRVLDYEKIHGANESTYWILFELLWRDFFFYLGQLVGPQTYFPSGFRSRRSPGLVDSYPWTYKSQPPEPRYREDFVRWIRGETGQDLVDAGMKELSNRGTLSNRLRQCVASFLIYDLALPWWWGAAWFEYALLDYDPDSNWGNWAYLAGVGADPRPSRRFDLEKQARTYDPDGAYRRWVTEQNWPPAWEEVFNG